MVTDPATSTAQARYHHGNLRPALLEAAGAMLEEGEADSVSLREVSRRAGVSTRAPYRHFASKDALLSALATGGFDQLRAQLVEAGEMPSGQVLRSQAIAYVRFALRHPALFRLMFSYTIRDAEPDLRDAKQATKTLLARSVAADPRAGPDVTAKALGSWSLVHGLAILILDGLATEDIPATDDELVQRVIGAMFPAE